MTSGPPPPQPLPLPEDANRVPPKPTQTQTLISGGFAFVYNFQEFYKSWNACDTDSVCKMEKILLFITIVFGISKPLLLLSDTLENAVNKLWMKLQGQILIQKNSGWSTSMQFLAIFGMLDQYLTKGWNWIRYATDCLKQDRCENDDILIWITNMKIRYCGRRTDLDDDELLECDTNGQNCKIMDEEGKINTGATCIAFFNKVPLIFAGIVIWTIYFQLNNIIDFFKKLTPGDGGGGGGAPKEAKKDDNANKTKDDSSHGQDNTKTSGSQKGPGEPAQDPSPNTQPSQNVGGGSRDQNGNSDQGNDKGAGDGPNATGNDKGGGASTNTTGNNGKEDSATNSNKTENCNECKGKGDTTGASGGQENSSKDDTKTKCQDKTKQKSPSKTKGKESERPKGESKSSNNIPPIQYFDVSCVLCRKLYIGCFPDPLPMFCEACNPNSPSKQSTSSKDPANPDPNNQPSTSSKPAPAVPSSTETLPGNPGMTVWKCGDPSSVQLPHISYHSSRLVPNQQSPPNLSAEEEKVSDLDSSDEELLELLLSLEDEWELNINHELDQCLKCQNQPHNHIDPSLQQTQ